MERGINDEGRYKITIEPITQEAHPLNNGAPLILETNGFFMIVDDIMNHELGTIVHNISPKMIAIGIAESEIRTEIAQALVIAAIARQERERKS